MSFVAEDAIMKPENLVQGNKNQFDNHGVTLCHPAWLVNNSKSFE
jgi:hypothetical protein